MSSKHFNSLDGLRGLAILLVFVYHAHNHLITAGRFGFLCSGGWVGVDLFFVLSGFLITGILFDSRNSESFYRNFYIRRTLRLFPVYCVFIFVVLWVAHGHIGHPWGLTTAYVLYASNIVRFFQPDFFKIGPVETGHLWSLAVEEQFYLLWPWIVVALGTRKRILVTCIYGSIASLGLRLVLAHAGFHDLKFLYLELPTRADSLLLGGAVAMLYRDPEYSSRVPRHYVKLVGATACSGFLAIAHHIYSFDFWEPLIATWGLSLTAIASSCLLLLALGSGTWTNRILSVPILRFYGRYSYALYLFHYAPRSYYDEVLWPFIFRHLHSLLLTRCVFLCMTLAFSTVLAVISFYVIEQPFLKMKKRFETRASELQPDLVSVT
jgi:peptidoglycan/LPS O-acetylase OafA/YrhL